jgi:hypothetical protein
MTPPQMQTRTPAPLRCGECSIDGSGAVGLRRMLWDCGLAASSFSFSAYFLCISVSRPTQGNVYGTRVVLCKECCHVYY